MSLRPPPNPFTHTKWHHLRRDPACNPSKRWAHTSTLIGSDLYIFGGSLDKDTSIPDDTFYRLSLETTKFQRIKDVTTPRLRDSHVAWKHNDMLYIWGGITDERVTNECYVYDKVKWQKVVQKGVVPAPRESAIASIKGDSLLMYGGCDQEIVYDDFHVLNMKTLTWFKLPHNGFQRRQNATLSRIGKYFYLFGGQAEINEEQKFYNQVHRIELGITRSAIRGRIKHVFPKYPYLSPHSNFQTQPQPQPLSPCQRASHAASGYSQRFLIIIGGITYTVSKADSLHILADVWCFDTQLFTWTSVLPLNPSLFKKHANFTADVYQDTIIIFGGLKSTSGGCYDQVTVFELYDVKDYNLNQICAECKMPYVGGEELEREKEIDKKRQWRERDREWVDSQSEKELSQGSDENENLVQKNWEWQTKWEEVEPEQGERGRRWKTRRRKKWLYGDELKVKKNNKNTKRRKGEKIREVESQEELVVEMERMDVFEFEEKGERKNQEEEERKKKCQKEKEKQEEKKKQKEIKMEIETQKQKQLQIQKQIQKEREKEIQHQKYRQIQQNIQLQLQKQQECQQKEMKVKIQTEKGIIKEKGMEIEQEPHPSPQLEADRERDRPRRGRRGRRGSKWRRIQVQRSSESQDDAPVNNPSPNAQTQSQSHPHQPSHPRSRSSSSTHSNPSGQSTPFPLSSPHQTLNLLRVYKTAQLIPHPFHAIGLLVRGSLLASATKLDIKLQEIDNRKVLIFLDDSLIITKPEFETILFNLCTPPPVAKSKNTFSDSPASVAGYNSNIACYANYLRYGCFKLSSSFLFVHSNETLNLAAVVTSENVYYYNLYYNEKYHQTDENNYRKLVDYFAVKGLFEGIGQKYQHGYTMKRVLFEMNCDGKKSGYEIGLEGEGKQKEREKEIEQQKEKEKQQKMQYKQKDINQQIQKEFLRQNQPQKYHQRQLSRQKLKSRDIVLRRVVQLGSECGESLREYLSDLFLEPTEMKITVNGQPVKFNPKEVTYKRVVNAITVAIMKEKRRGRGRKKGKRSAGKVTGIGTKSESGIATGVGTAPSKTGIVKTKDGFPMPKPIISIIPQPNPQFSQFYVPKPIPISKSVSKLSSPSVSVPHQASVSNPISTPTISSISSTRPYFRVYSNGFMIAKLTSFKYRVGGIVVLPDSWDINVLGMGVSQELGYLGEVVDEVVEGMRREKEKKEREKRGRQKEKERKKGEREKEKCM